MTGCQSLTPAQSAASARRQAISEGFTPAMIDTGRFELSAYHRGLNSRSDRLVIYIEGDGHAFISRRRVSDNPTPRDPVALKMALADPSAAVAYLARPCQFIQPLPASCDSRYWTTHRYAPEVVTAINYAIDELQQRGGSDRIGLVGYSGGGVIATLIAQRRDDVDWLVTVAANLDHAAWTAWHEDTPLTGSLNPAGHTQDLAGIAQLHLAGKDDETVPPALIADFVRELPVDTAVELLILDNVDHNDWADVWPQRICEFRFWQELESCAGS